MCTLDHYDLRTAENGIEGGAFVSNHEPIQECIQHGATCALWEASGKASFRLLYKHIYIYILDPVFPGE